MFAGGIPYTKKKRPPSIQFCTVREADGKTCGRPALANGVCSRHYHRAYWHRRKVKGDLGAAWTPKIISGGRVVVSFMERIPEHYEERKAFKAGFIDAVRRVPPTRDPHDLPAAYREGYAVGREVREDSKQVADVMHAIGHKPYGRAEPGGTREQGIQRLVARVKRTQYVVKDRPSVGATRAAGGIKHVGGRRLSVKNLCDHFAYSDAPAHSSGGAWTDGVVFYSFYQPIAKKRVYAASREQSPTLPAIVELDPRVFSPTTTRHQTWIGVAVRRAGWTVEYRNLGGPKRR